jgi:hypothetical protein
MTAFKIANFLMYALDSLGSRFSFFPFAWLEAASRPQVLP